MDLGGRLPLPNLPFVLVALFTYIGVRCYLNYKRAPQFPGPFLAKISSIWLLAHTFSGKLNQHNAALLERYGSPVRIAPDKILTNDPIILRHMSTSRSNFRRGTFYDAFSLQPPLQNVLSQKDEKLHNTLRAKLIRGYSGKDLPKLDSEIDSNIIKLVKLIRTESAAGRPVDFSSLAQYFTLDVLTHIAFSAPIGYLTQNKDVYYYIRTVSSFLKILELGANSSGVQAILGSSLMAPMRPKPTDKDGMGAMMRIAKKAVAERFGPRPKVEQDMLGSFVKCGLTQEEAESEAMVQVLGGSDSTAAAIRMILLYVITNPAVYVKLVKELNENDGHFIDDLITSANSRKLPYLQACINEGLRMWPPLQALNSKLSSPGGESVNGVYILGKWHSGGKANIAILFDAVAQLQQMFCPYQISCMPRRLIFTQAASRSATTPTPPNADQRSMAPMPTPSVQNAGLKLLAKPGPQTPNISTALFHPSTRPTSSKNHP